MHGKAEPEVPLAHSDHFNGERFFNPHAAAAQEHRRRTPLAPRAPEAAVAGARRGPTLPPPARAAPDRISATFIGHSTFLVQVGGICVLTGPDLVRPLQPGLVCRPAACAAAGTEPGRAAGRRPAAGHAQPLRPHGSADLAPACATLVAADGDRPRQRAPPCEGRDPVGGRTRLVAEHGPRRRARHLRAGAAFFVAHVA